MLRTLRLALIASLLALALPAGAVENWKTNEKRCMESFRNYDVVRLQELHDCTALWVAYRSPSQIKEAEKLVAVQAMNHLYVKGDDAGAYLAEQALYAMGEAPKEQRAGSQPPPGVQAQPGATPDRAQRRVQPEPDDRPARETYDPAPVPESRTKKARALNEKGYKAAKRPGSERKALQLYEQAIEADPRYEMAIYNASCIYAQLDQPATALEYLRRLVDLSTDTARDQLQKARMDEDLVPLRGRQEFKDLTGYAVIELQNSQGEYGEDEVDRIEKYITEVDHPIERVGDYNPPLPYPVVFHKGGGARNTAIILSSLVNHPRTAFQELPADHRADIVIVWGDTYPVDPRTGEPKVAEYGFKGSDPEKPVKDARREQDKALREPDKYAREVDHRARTGARVKSDGENSVRRVEQTIDTIDRTTETLKTGGGLMK
jgi:tetratricopeptide (TPR) repeat protein